MIEKKYTGVAKQGADVVANPTLDGTEQALNSIRINGENFKIEGGSGKLKLVATAYSQGQEGTERQFKLQLNDNKELYVNKLYYVKIKNLELEYINGFVFNIESNSYCEVYSYEDDNRLTAIASYVKNGNYAYIKCINIENEEAIYVNNTCEIYELEFGGSSGGESDVTKDYVDTLVGDINTLLDAINGEVI